jgi:hypothetical protein
VVSDDPFIQQTQLLMQLRLNQIESDKRQAEMSRQIAATHELAKDALQVAVDNGHEVRDVRDTLVKQIGVGEGWCTAVAYAGRNGIPSDRFTLNRLGRVASDVGRERGLTPEKVPHAYYPEVNAWPEAVWIEAARRCRQLGVFQ